MALSVADALNLVETQSGNLKKLGTLGQVGWVFLGIVLSSISQPQPFLDSVELVSLTAWGIVLIALGVQQYVAFYSLKAKVVTKFLEEGRVV